MGTISKDIATDIIFNNKYRDEAAYIVTYNNMFDGSLTYAAIMFGESKTKYHDSPACHNVKLIWTNPTVAKTGDKRLPR